jgi:hypothetical protein
MTRGLALLLVMCLSLGAVAFAYAPRAAQAPFADEPALTPTPRARCGPGSRPETGIQGRVTPEDHESGRAAQGFTCNTELVGQYSKPNAQGTVGGFKVERYVDAAGHECAYYDTALFFPLNAFNLDGKGLGLAVLDMADPSHPVQTDMLTDPAMLSPHESVNFNARRGLLAAVDSNAGATGGLVSIYSVRADCRHPVLQSSAVVARFGHESGFSTDGRTFYATGTNEQSITAIDVTDPKAPHPLWQGNLVSHGMSLSDDGNRAYIADPTIGNRNLLILDTSEIQARRPNPQAKEIARLTWDRASIPQNTIPFTAKGHPYVLEFDEYNEGTQASGPPDNVGAARIVDIADETAPRIVSHLRLEVNEPAGHAAASGDPGVLNGLQGYAAHYCGLPSRKDPKVVACSFILSGLRVFDISDVLRPREIAYYVAPTRGKVENGFQPSDFAMSQPAFVPERREVWYTDGTSGFYALRISKAAWPR